MQINPHDDEPERLVTLKHKLDRVNPDAKPDGYSSLETMERDEPASFMDRPIGVERITHDQTPRLLE